MNILLTGNVQVGKTTLINRLIKDLNITACGFCTSRHFAQGEHDGFIIEEISGTLTSGQSSYYIAKGHPGIGWQPIPATFETIGVKILKNCLKTKSDLIIMDELGHFESQAPLFQEHVHQCLSSAIPVFGVVKPRSTPFLDSIRQRNDVQIITISPANRNDQYFTLKKLLQQSLKHTAL